MFERCLYFNSNHLARAVERIWKQAYAELGLAPAHAYLLRLVLENPGLAQKEIAAQLNLEKSTVTRFIDKMEVEGYLRRTYNGTEQTIVPTAKAQRIQSRLQEIGDELYGRMQKAIGHGEMASLVAGIRKTANHLD